MAASKVARIAPRPSPLWLFVPAISIILVAWRVTSSEEPRPTTPDLYERSLSSIVTGTALPSEMPPDLEWVFLQGVDGGQVATFQHEDAVVRVCRYREEISCGRGGARLRVFTLGGKRFVITYTSLASPPASSFTLPGSLREYWTNADFTQRRPRWLSMRFFPGGAYGDE